jgi:hypothetical protein
VTTKDSDWIIVEEDQHQAVPADNRCWLAMTVVVVCWIMTMTTVGEGGRVVLFFGMLLRVVPVAVLLVWVSWAV